MIEVSTNMKNSIQKTVDKLDYALISIVILLFIISLFSIYSAAGQYNDDPTFYLTRQAVWFVIGLVVIVFILSLEYEHYRSLVILLLFVYLYSYFIIYHQFVFYI